jgi:hypothetical protein
MDLLQEKLSLTTLLLCLHLDKYKKINMKTIVIIVLSLIANVFYAQSTDEIESFKHLNNDIVINTIPSLAGKEYFIWDVKPKNVIVISKINNNYTYYDIEIGHNELVNHKVIDTKTLSYIPIFDKIFTNFVPKVGVKRYVSEYPRESMQITYYFAIFKNGVKTFETCLPYKVNGILTESSIDDEILNFLYIDLFFNLDKLVLYNNTIKTGTFKRNNCGAGQTGSSVLYTVPAGKYNSTISQADADAQAQADVNANGQNNANNQGTCKKGNVKVIEPEE